MTDPLMEAIIIRPFLEFAESWQKHKMATAILYSISLVLGYSDEALFPNPAASEFVYRFVALFLASSALMLFKPKETPAFPLSVPFMAIAIVWIFSVIGVIGLELMLAIQIMLWVPVLSLQGMAALVFFVIPTVVAFFKSRMR